MQVVAAEFLPCEKQLLIVIADADCKLHVLEYNPERQYTSSVADILANAFLSQILNHSPASGSCSEVLITLVTSLRP